MPGIASALPPVADIPFLSLENSPLVTKSPDGTLGVAQKNGAPIDGVKLSQHDMLILSPHIAVTSDGTLHVSFTEQNARSPFTLFVYYRKSTDGGKTWSDAKNLSEDMPNIPVGESTLLADGSDRVYVIWRAGLQEYYPVGAGQSDNLLYRVLDHGKWSKILYVHPAGSLATQNDGSYFSFASVDGSGKAQIVWNTCPDHFLPDQVMAKNFAMHLAGIGNGLVYQVTLDGSTPSVPRQIFMTKVTQDPNPAGLGEMSKTCDDLSALDGYVDPAGNAHFIALARAVRGSEQASAISLFEAGKQSPAITLPAPYMEIWHNPPKLLVDAKGHQHIIALYTAGEHPSFRDYTLGSDDDPVVILSPKTPRGTCMGFQAYQGPNGRMAVVMQITDAGFNDSGDSWISLSTDDAWSSPVCITNNAARANFAAKNTGATGDVILSRHYGPGAGAVSFDKDGHLLLAICNVKTGSFALGSGGVAYTGGSTATPMLFFYKF